MKCLEKYSIGIVPKCFGLLILTIQRQKEAVNEKMLHMLIILWQSFGTIGLGEGRVESLMHLWNWILLLIRCLWIELVSQIIPEYNCVNLSII